MGQWKRDGCWESHSYLFLSFPLYILLLIVCLCVLPSICFSFRLPLLSFIFIYSSLLLLSFSQISGRLNRIQTATSVDEITTALQVVIYQLTQISTITKNPVKTTAADTEKTDFQLSKLTFFFCFLSFSFVLLFKYDFLVWLCLPQFPSFFFPSFYSFFPFHPSAPSFLYFFIFLHLALGSTR